MKKSIVILLSSFTLLLVLLSSFTLLVVTTPHALASENQQGPSDRRGPPPEAFEACEGLSSGDSANFEGRNGDLISGTCESDRDGTLVLRPDTPPQNRE